MNTDEMKPFGLGIDDMQASRELDWLIEGRVMGRDVVAGVPHYSTDIAAAWQVIERLKSLGYWFSTENHHDQWGVTFEKDCKEFDSNAEIAPLAICRAALKAVSQAKTTEGRERYAT